MEWNLTKNGHSPSEPIKCPICGDIMKLRWSIIQSHQDIAMELFFRRPDEEKSKYLLKIFDEVENPSWVNDMSWKCPKCSLVLMFGVPMEKKEAHRIKLEERNGEGTFIPVEDWWEDEIIKDRLRNLGYW